VKLLQLAALRFLLQARWSTVTVVVGIALGVASVSAVHLISTSINTALADVTPVYRRELSYLIEKPDLQMGDYFELRAAWRRGDLPGVTGMVPIIEGQLLLDDNTLRVVGVDAFSGLSSTLSLAGLSPRGVIAAAGAIRQLELDPDAVRIGQPLAESGPLAQFHVERSLAGVAERLLIADLGTAQELLQLPPGALSRVGVQVEHPLLQLQRFLDRLLPGFGAGFAGYHWSLPGWQVHGLDSELPSQAFAQSVLFNLGALGTLALVVSWLLVYQVSLIWLRRRRTTMTMLQLQGVTRFELLSGYLGSVLPLALVATALGIVAGWGLAHLLSRIATAGVEMRVGLPQPDTWLLGKALVSGVGVSLAGGYLAFRQEWRTASAVVGAALLWVVLLVSAAAFGIWYVEALWGGFVAIVAVSLAVILLITPVLNWTKTALQQVPGLSLLARIGVRELVFQPRALSVAIAALTLAIASSMAIGIMVDSFRQDFTRMLEHRLTHDVFVRSSGVDLSAAQEALQGLPEVSAVVAAGQTRIRVRGRPVELGYARFDESEARRYGARAALAPGQALASERLLREFGLQPGDSVHLASGVLDLVGVFPGFGDARPRLLVDLATARQMGVNTGFDRLSISASATGPVTRLLARDFPQLQVELAEPLRTRALAIFDQTFAITRALTLLALLVACIGLYNALLGLKLNQQPVLALLASMGTSAAELRRVALWRGLAVSGGIAVFALPLGLAMGWLLCNVVNPRAFGWSLQLQLTVEVIAVPLLLGLAVTVATSLLPVPAEALREST